MKTTIVLLLTVVLVAALTGCGGGDSTNVQNPPAPPPSNLSVAFDPAPPTAIKVNAVTPITAVVDNDPSGAGVDWLLTCQGSTSCGTLSPLHTQSGDATTYTPPAGMTANSQDVTIIAFATANHSKNATTPLNITGFAGTLKGTYIMQAVGVTAIGYGYQFMAAVVLDGNGSVSAGEQTVHLVDPNSFTPVTYSDAITGGNYFVGTDGRGTLTINTANQSIGQLGVEGFSFAILSHDHLFITRMDDLSNNQAQSFETASGTMDLQTTTATPTGAYAFVAYGMDALLTPNGLGGVMNIDSPNTISGAGSIADQDLGGGLYTNASLTGTVSDPDAFGAVTITLSTYFAPSFQFTGFIVDSTHIRLIENELSLGTPFGYTAGLAISQGSAAGTFTSNSTFTGTYVFGVLGQDYSFFPTSLASVGIFSADGNGLLARGVNDAFFGGFGTQVRDQFHATYTVDPTGTGRVDSLFTYPGSGQGPEFIFYLTGNGNPPLILDADFNLMGFGGGGVGTGIAFPATVPSPFTGSYALYLTQSVFGSETDMAGQMTVDGGALTVNGVVDANSFFTPVPTTTLTGTFNALTSSGRSRALLTNAVFPAAPMSVELYFIDAEHGFMIENDSLQTFSLGFGYFATRTPICGGCP
ncbi:MAG TPA: hypothetical protein VH437_03980 [Terriglobales bacterium]|jgi:hypothetical protein